MDETLFRPSPVSSPLIKLRTAGGHDRVLTEQQTPSPKLVPPTNPRRVSATPIDASHAMSDRPLRESVDLYSEGANSKASRRSKLMQSLRRRSRSSTANESTLPPSSLPSAIEQTTVSEPPKKKKGFFKRMFGSSKKKEVPALDLEATQTNSSYSSKPSGSRGENSYEQSHYSSAGRSSRSSSIRGIFHLRSGSRQNSPRESSHYSGSEDVSNLSFMPADYQSTSAMMHLSPEEKKKKRGLFRKMFGSSKKKEETRQSVSFVQDDTTTIGGLSPHVMNMSADQVSVSNTLSVPSKKKSGAWNPFKKKKKKTPEFDQVSVTDRGDLETPPPQLEDPEALALNTLFDQTESQLASKTTKSEVIITEENIRKEEIQRLNRLRDETKEDFLETLRDVQKRFFIKQGKHCLWKYQKIKTLLSKDYGGELPEKTTIQEAEISAMDEFLNRQTQHEKLDLEDEAKLLLNSSKILMQVAQTGKLQDLKRVDWRVVNIQEQIDSMKVAFSIQQVGNLIHTMFDDEKYKHSLKDLLIKSDEQIESWVQSGFIEQLEHGLDVNVSDLKRIGQLRQGHLLLTHLDTLMSLASKAAHESYYKDMENLASEIESLRNNINRVIDNSFDYLKCALLPTTGVFQQSTYDKYRPRLPSDDPDENFALPPFISRKLKIVDLSSPPVSETTTDLVQKKVFMLRRLTQRANMPVGEGFEIASTRADLEAMEARLRGKWGSYSLFERWLHDAMRWQWQDVCSQNALRESKIGLETVIEDKKRLMKENVDKRLTQLWTGRATAAKEEAVERLYRYLTEAVAQRPPVFVAVDQVQKERDAMNYEHDRGLMTRILEGSTGRELLRKHHKELLTKSDKPRAGTLTVSSKQDVDKIITMAKDIRTALDKDQTMIRDVELQALLEDMERETEHVWAQVEQVVKTRQNKELTYERRKLEYEEALQAAQDTLAQEKIKLSEIDDLNLNDKEEELNQLQQEVDHVQNQVIALSESKKANKIRLKELEKEIRVNKKKLAEEQKKFKLIAKSASTYSNQLSAQESKNDQLLAKTSDLRSPNYLTLPQSRLPQDSNSVAATSDMQSSVMTGSPQKKKKKWYNLIAGSSKPKPNYDEDAALQALRQLESDSEESPRISPPETPYFDEALSPRPPSEEEEESPRASVQDTLRPTVVEEPPLRRSSSLKETRLRLTARSQSFENGRPTRVRSGKQLRSSPSSRKGLWKKLVGKSSSKKSASVAGSVEQASDPLGERLAETDKKKKKRWTWMGGSRKSRKARDNHSDGNWSESGSWLTHSRRNTDASPTEDFGVDDDVGHVTQRFSIITPTSEVTLPSARRASADIRQADGDIRQTDGDIRQADGDIRQADGDIRRADNDIRRADDDIRRADGDIRQADNRRPDEEPVVISMSDGDEVQSDLMDPPKLDLQQSLLDPNVTPEEKSPRFGESSKITSSDESQFKRQNSPLSFAPDEMKPIVIQEPTTLTPSRFSEPARLSEVTEPKVIEAPRSADNYTTESLPQIIVKSQESFSASEGMTPVAIGSPTLPSIFASLPEAPRIDAEEIEPRPRRLRSESSSSRSPQPILPSPQEKHVPPPLDYQPRKASSSTLTKQRQSVSWHRVEEEPMSGIPLTPSEVSSVKKKKKPMMGWASKLLQPGRKRRSSAAPVLGRSFDDDQSPMERRRSFHQSPASEEEPLRYVIKARRASASTRVLFNDDFGPNAVPRLEDILARWQPTCMMSPDERTQIDRESEKITFDQGDVVCQLGDLLDSIIVVESGRLDGTDGSGAVMEVFRAADVVFDSEWLESLDRENLRRRAPLTVAATEDNTTVWLVPGQSLRQLVSESHRRTIEELHRHIRSLGPFRSLTYVESIDLAQQLRPRVMGQSSSLSEELSCKSFWIVWKGSMLASNLLDEKTEQYYPKDVFGLEQFLTEKDHEGPIILTAQESPAILFEVNARTIERTLQLSLYEFLRRLDPQDIGQMESVSVIGEKTKKKKGLGNVAKLLGMKKKRRAGSVTSLEEEPPRRLDTSRSASI